MILVNSVKIKPEELKGLSRDEVLSLLKARVIRELRCKEGEILSLKIKRRSLDARKRADLFYIFSLLLEVNNEKRFLKEHPSKKAELFEEKGFFIDAAPDGPRKSPVVVGFGPAGIGAAYLLAKAGLNPIIIERGSSVEKRLEDVEAFHKGGLLNPESNVQFGEGGAGAFSDGKLNTGNKDKDGIFGEILKALYNHGAPEEIIYDAKPHLGTDLLRDVVRNLREHIKKMGGNFLFDTALTGIEFDGEGRVRAAVIKGPKGEDLIETDRLILAIGHSARDTFLNLYSRGLVLTPKPFAMGYRVLHNQDFINEAMYGAGWNEKGLPAASYKLTGQGESGRPVFSFCMCPGGFVVDSSSEEGRLCINGMSYHLREGMYANSAIVMGISPDEVGAYVSPDALKEYEKSPLLGMIFQREAEEKAYKPGRGRIPLMSLDGKEVSLDYKRAFKGEASFCGDFVRENLILPGELNRDFIYAMEGFGKTIRGFDCGDTLVAAVESRTSCPVRMDRTEDMQAVGHPGLYPCGEGAGFAGGIMSAARDGVRTAAQIIKELSKG